MKIKLQPLASVQNAESKLNAQSSIQTTGTNNPNSLQKPVTFWYINTYLHPKEKIETTSNVGEIFQKVAEVR